MPPPRLIPVVDLLGGAVVRAVRGNRAAYRPVVSRLVDSAEPLAVAGALRRAAGTDELYVADLDAIAGREPSRAVWAGLVAAGHRLMLDAGVRDASGAEGVAAVGGAVTVVAGLETLPSPAALRDIAERLRGRVAFSLDLRDGRPLGGEGWPTEAESVARLAAEAGVGRMIVLDLARVGAGEGPPDAGLLSRLRRDWPGELLVGGGVRGPDDLLSLGNLGIDAVLVASALHDGTVGRTSDPTIPLLPVRSET
jgi:phosphoribosylformimino-5-aminoimidazole carboxamide ribotide isomerase